VSRPCQEVHLKDTESGTLVPAVLCEGLSDQNLKDYEHLWRPLLLDNAIRVLLRLKPIESTPEDMHWDWRNKLVASAQAPLAFREYAIECEGETQGLMQINLGLNNSRLEPGKPLLYVQYVQTAPWNRGKIPNRRKYALVGTLLLMTAIRVSEEEGFNGRIGLHSLPRAETFYKGRFMTEFENDITHQNLKYYELNEKSAAGMLDNMKKMGTQHD